LRRSAQWCHLETDAVDVSVDVVVVVDVDGDGGVDVGDVGATR
jgi:hypothetical protein